MFHHSRVQWVLDRLLVGEPSQDEKIKELLNINHSELEVLYQKFGLTNKQRVRDMQLTTIMAMNNLITPELIMHTKKRFNLIELKEMIDFYKKNL